MKARIITSMGALALILSANQGLAQSSQDNDQRMQRQDRSVTQPQQEPGTQPNAQRRVRQIPETGGQSQQNAQQPSASQQQNGQQPSTSTQQNAQQPSSSTQQNAQQPSSTQRNAQQPAQRSAPSAAQQPSTQQNAQQPSTQQNAQQPAQQSAPSTAQSPQQGRQGAVALNAQQQTEVSRAVASLNVRPVTNVNFSLSVGVAVPSRISLRPLPSSIVTIVPQYRGYNFIVVERQIVIIEPRTRHIVALLPYDGSSARAQAQPSRAAKFTEQQRSVIRKGLGSNARATTGRGSSRVIVGEEVPTTIELQEFPETIYRDVPTVREYRYYTRDRDVIVVDPAERRVIEVIE